MLDNLKLMAKLMAYQYRKAVPFADTCQYLIQEHAKILVPIKMAGEHATIHAIGIGEIGKPVRIYSIPDPRYFTDRQQLWSAMLQELQPYANQCLQSGTSPQIIVSSQDGINLLDAVADKIRYQKKDPSERALGELLSYHTERYPVAGQQALLSATSFLKAHWVIGQTSGSEEHLKILLTWINPPPYTDIYDAIEQAEITPMGASTLPDFDKNVLHDLVVEYNTHRKSNNTQQQGLAKQIHQALTQAINPIYDCIQEAISVLHKENWPLLESLYEFEEIEKSAFASFQQSRQKGYPLSLNDSSKAAAFRISEREIAVQNLEASRISQDSFAQAEAKISGKLLQAKLHHYQKIRLRPRVFEYRLQIESSQEVLHLRQGDVLYSVCHGKTQFLVRQIQKSNGTTSIHLTILSGMRKFHNSPPNIGTILHFTKTIPDWSRLLQSRRQMKNRTQSMPWTHCQGSLPNSNPHTNISQNPLADVEALR